MCAELANKGIATVEADFRTARLDDGFMQSIEKVIGKNADSRESRESPIFKSINGCENNTKLREF